MTVTRFGAVVALVLVLAGAGCSSGESSSDGGTSTTAAERSGPDDSTSAGSPEPVSVCPLLDEADLATVGVTGPGKPTERVGPPGIALGACSWGSIDTELLVVQVESRGADIIVDPLAGATKAAKSAPKPASQPAGAKVIDIALLPSGGGTGTSVVADQGSELVVVSRFGDDVDVPALEALTAKVVDAL